MVRILQLLDKAFLVHTLYQESKSISTLNKPDKSWLRNTNIMYALAKVKAEIGTLRETFILQMLSGFHKLSLLPKGDFLIDQKYTIEVGGKSKNTQQIHGIQNAYIKKTL